MQESSFYMLLMNSSLVLFWTPSGHDLLASSPLKQTLHQPVKSNGTSLIAIHQASLTPHGSLRGLMKYFISGDDYTWVQHFSQMHEREISFYIPVKYVASHWEYELLCWLYVQSCVLNGKICTIYVWVMMSQGLITCYVNSVIRNYPFF